MFSFRGFNSEGRPLRKRMFFYSLVAMVGIGVFAESANAFTFVITKRNEPKLLVGRKASLEGTYALNAGETLKSVTFVYLGTAAGTFTSNPKAWKAEVGDYQLSTYRVDFLVQKSGRNFRYSSQTFTYGK